MITKQNVRQIRFAIDHISLRYRKYLIMTALSAGNSDTLCNVQIKQYNLLIYELKSKKCIFINVHNNFFLNCVFYLFSNKKNHSQIGSKLSKMQQISLCCVRDVDPFVTSKPLDGGHVVSALYSLNIVSFLVHRRMRKPKEGVEVIAYLPDLP